VVDRLRELKKYQNPTVPRGSAKKRLPPRVVISREPLTDLPHPLTYFLQSFWPHRPKGKFGGRTEEKRGERRRRIPEPSHTQKLLWMDLWSLADITLLVGLRVTSSGFKITKP